jgi:hypothetical protein
MSDIRTQEQIDEMRKRLYDRSFTEQATRHPLEERDVTVARDWQYAADTKVEAPEVEVAEDSPTISHGYRKIVLVGTLLVALVSAFVAAAFWYFGQDNISGDNISLHVSGPATIGGSETMSLQVGLTNQNTVTVESAVLVLKYPSGTRSVGEPVKNLYEERISLGTLAPGEARNIPLQVAIYGKENDSKQIEATLEYKIVGSDGTFYKVAEPLEFKITSSPIIMQVSSVRKISAGQDVEIIVQVKSNTSVIQKDVLVTASYPNGFSYKSSTPEPIYNQNTWKIEELKPGQGSVIKIKGTVTGLTGESFGINLSAGAAETDNQFIVGSLLAEARTEFVIESPFLEVGIKIDGDGDGSTVLQEGKGAGVSIAIKNTLDESVYDMVVEVVPSGNVLSSRSVTSGTGYYDSNKNVVRWEVSNNPGFGQVTPGSSQEIGFGISPASLTGASSFDLTVNVYARRVAEQHAQEQLVGTAKASAKYTSSASVTGHVNLMSGPIPPIVGQTTTYLVAFVAEAGINDVSKTVVRTSLPTYVTWLNDFSGSGTVTYNPVTKMLEWNVGDIDGGKKKELIFSVSISPSTSLIGVAPALTGSIDLYAVDRFTATPLRSFIQPLTTELPPGAGYDEGNGRVSEY